MLVFRKESGKHGFKQERNSVGADGSRPEITEY